MAFVIKIVTFLFLYSVCIKSVSSAIVNQKNAVPKIFDPITPAIKARNSDVANIDKEYKEEVSYIPRGKESGANNFKSNKYETKETTKMNGSANKNSLSFLVVVAFFAPFIALFC